MIDACIVLMNFTVELYIRSRFCKPAMLQKNFLFLPHIAGLQTEKTRYNKLTEFLKWVE